MTDESEGMIASLIKTIKQNWRLLLVGVIVLAIALNSSWSDNRSSAENKNETSSTPQAEQTEGSEQNIVKGETKNAENDTNEVAQIEEAKTAPVNTDVIAQVATRSEGVTHLARKAIKEYLGNTQESLSAEQKIYAEDYLSKKTGTKALEVGEKIEFSTDLIKQGVEQAKGLNQEQIKNLSKYVPLVKNLN